MTSDEIKELVNSPDYYNRFDKNKNWEYILLFVGRPTQAAEINELQNLLEEKIKAIGKSFYEDEIIISGCEISVNTSTKKATIEAGKFFLDGLIYEVPKKTLTISTSEAQIGVWKISSLITDYDDVSLLNPAIGYPEYNSPGAFRISTQTQWGLSTEKHNNATFTAVYKLSSGFITRLKKRKPDIVRYDIHAHGNYAVSGLNVTAVANSTAGKQTFKISEGLAHIDGYETELFQAFTLNVDEMPELSEIQDEPYSFAADSSGKMKISLSHTPIESISKVRVTKERTVTLTHGNEENCKDALPDDSVFEILEVKQGALIFTKDTDFTLDNDSLDWSLSGEEPTPGTKYKVTYHYRVNISPDSFDKKSVTVSGLFEDSLVEVSYFYRVPRKDIIVMYEDCSVSIVRGSSIVPDTPAGAICLAEVSQTWVTKLLRKI